MNKYLESVKGYQGNKQVAPTLKTKESILERIALSSTRILENRGRQYNIDNCHCPTCGCTNRPILLPLSPGGIATSVTIFAATSAM